MSFYPRVLTASTVYALKCLTFENRVAQPPDSLLHIDFERQCHNFTFSGFFPLLRRLELDAVVLFLFSLSLSLGRPLRLFHFIVSR